jgi:hypothetical protein
MIPYEQLVAALASWRQRQGLPAGPADYLGEPAAAAYDDESGQPAEGAYGGDPYGSGAYGNQGYGPSPYGEDVVELSDDMMDSVVEEPSSPWSVEASEMADDGSAMSDTQDEGTYAEPAPEPPKPEPEPEPPSGKRKRRR